MMLSGYTCKASVNVRRKWRKIYGLLDMRKSEKVFFASTVCCRRGNGIPHSSGLVWTQCKACLWCSTVSRVWDDNRKKIFEIDNLLLKFFVCFSSLGTRKKLWTAAAAVRTKKKVFWTHGKKLNWLIWQTSVRRTTEWDSIEVQHFPQREREKIPSYEIYRS